MSCGEFKVSFVPESDSMSTYSVAESIKKHKRHDKSKKHKKHKKKSKKSKKKKHHSRFNSPNDYIELRLKQNKLEEAESGMPVTLDVVMETIVNTANEKSDEVRDNLYDKNKYHLIDNNLTEENKLQILENNINQTKCSTVGINNGKIIIKDLKESRLYHKLINEVQEKERLKAEKHENDVLLNCSLHELDKKKKKEKHKSKKRKRSGSRNRSITPKRHKKHKRSHSRSSRDRYSRHDDFKSRKSDSRDQNDSNLKCRTKDSDNKFKDKNDHYRKLTITDKDPKLIRRSRSKESKKFKRSTDYDRTKKRSKSKETSSNRTRHRSPSCEKIDKKKLFKIARKNALSLVQQGVLPVGSVKKDSIANIPTKTVDELTDFCRTLSKKDKEQDDDTSFSSDDEEFKQPFHHPFLVKERPNIVMNIRNATQLPIKSFQEKTIGQDILRQQFPVSSGQIHSLAVNEWVPLGPEESAKLNKISQPEENNKLTCKSQIQQSPKVIPVRLTPEPVVKPVSSTNSAVVLMEYQYPSPSAVEPSTFANSYVHGSYSLLSYETGQFTGHTGAKVLTPAELSAGYQPWVKKAVLLVFNIFKRYINNTTIGRRFVC
uniref:Protein SON n=1 Tax=Sipha flava TaxID=143950 RepID=A0A2S2QHV8_9HEMI